MESKLLENTTLMIRILIIVFNVELLVLAVLGNVHMCIRLIDNLKNQKPSSYYFLNITLCNIILLAFLIYPDLYTWNFTVYDNEHDILNPEYNFHYFVEFLIRPLMYKIIATSVVLTLIAISVDMCVSASVHKTRNLDKLPEFRTTFINIFGIWIISIFSIIPGIYEYEMGQFIGVNAKDAQIFDSVKITSIYNMVHSVVFFFIPLLAMLIFFITKIWQSYNDNHSYLILNSTREIEAQEENKYKFKILAIVVFLYFIFWLPTFISNNKYYWKMLYHSQEAFRENSLMDLRKIINLRIFLLGTVIVPFMWNKIRSLKKSYTSSCYAINLKISAEKSFRLKQSKMKNNDVYE